MNVSDELLSEAAELLEEFSAQSIAEHARGGRLIGSPKAAKRVAATLRAAISTAERASDEGVVQASVQQVVRCYGKTPEGSDCVSTHTAQAICDMGLAQTILSCQNSLPASAIPTHTVGAQPAPLGYVKVEDFIEQGDEYVSMLNDLFALLQDVKAERDAALTQATVRPVREWQPIETAPKDGRTVIVNCREGRFAAYYYPYYAEGGMGYEGGDGWSESLSGEQVMTSYGSPTHWMPLPDAPNGVVDEENGA